MLYNIFTQWLTLGVIFFIGDYLGSFIKVVTLGGLVAGSFIMAAIVTAAERFSRRLSPFTGKAAIYSAALLAAEALCSFMPGYSMEQDVPVIIFLMLYALLAAFIGKLLGD